LAGFAGDSIAGSVTLGSDFGRLSWTSVTAVSAACFTVDWTVVRACFQNEFAIANDPSRRSPTMRMVLDSTAVPSFTSVRKTLPASDCAHSRVTTAAPKLASHT